MATSPATTAEALAVLLVHEVQHVKLGALLDICDLVDPRNSVGISVPWWQDVRPAEGALQGTYAHLSIAGIWHSRHVTMPGDEVAARNYRRYRDWTDTVIASLHGSGALTPAGQIFVERMAETLEGWS